MTQSLKFTCQAQWTDADGNSFSTKPWVMNCPYSMEDHGELVVPAGSTTGQEFDVPFYGGVTGATFVRVENLTGQELNSALGYNFSAHIPAGGCFYFAFPSSPSSVPILGWRFWLTQPQTTDSKIVYAFYGS